MSPAPGPAAAAGGGEGDGARRRGRQVLPVHTPILRLAGEPKSQKRPLCGSQGSRSVHSSPSCLAHTRQQPQPSGTRLTPAGQRGAGAAHRHGPRQSWPEAGCGASREEGVGGQPRRPPPAASRPIPSAPAPRGGGSGCLPRCRGRRGARRRRGRDPGRRRTWSGRCGAGPGVRRRRRRREDAGSGRGAEGGGLRAPDWSLVELSAGAAAVGLEAEGGWSGGSASPAGGDAPVPRLSREESLCEAGAGGPRLLYAPGGPGSPMS